MRAYISDSSCEQFSATVAMPQTFAIHKPPSDQGCKDQLTVKQWMCP